MITYTVAQVLEDIKNFEQIELTLEGPEDGLFFKLYSEYYDEPIHRNFTTEEIHAKVIEYLKRCGTPNLEVNPDEDAEYVTYYLLDGVYKKYGSYYDKDTAYAIFDDEELPSSEILVFEKETNEFYVYVRNTH